MHWAACCRTTPHLARLLEATPQAMCPDGLERWQVAVRLHLAPSTAPSPSWSPSCLCWRPPRTAHLHLSLENTPETFPDYVNAVFKVLDAIPQAAGRVGLCLDMGHANLFADTRNDCVRFVDLLGEHVPIIHWHAHENWGDGDSHLMLPKADPTRWRPWAIQAKIPNAGPRQGPDRAGARLAAAIS
jgi:hypothetical protein